MRETTKAEQTAAVMVLSLILATYLFLNFRPIGGMAVLAAGIAMGTEIATGALSIARLIGTLFIK